MTERRRWTLAQDDRRLDFYEREAETYVARGQEPQRRQLDAFLSLLPPDAYILELGCGAGQDSAYMLSKGFRVRPTDGTPEIARLAGRRLGVPVATLLFDDLDEVSTYDGIWANACLLHVPRADLPAVIARIYTALKSGAPFHASYKAGEADGRDQFGRYFNYPSGDWLRELYSAFGWREIAFRAYTGGGFDQRPTDWLHVTAIKG